MMIEVKCLYDELIPIKELKPHPKNRNKHPSGQIDRLAKIIAYQGIRAPIKVSRLSGFITAGHGRLEALKKLKIKQVPINFQEYESEEQEYADLQSDNAIASWAELDLSGINTDLSDLGPDFDIDLLGIEDFVLEPAEKFEAQSDEDEVPEYVEPICKLGDLWTLGRHRLLCGDSTSIDAVDKLTGGEKADMVFTDPPYGISYKNTKGGIMGDGSLDVFEGVCPLIPLVSKESSHIYIFFGVQLAAESLAILNKHFKQYNLLVMPITHQNKPGPPGYFNSNYELCYFTQIGEPKKHIRGAGSVSESTLNDSRYDGDGKLERYRALSEHVITEHNLKTVHPTEKKVSGISFYLEISSEENNLIIDLFGGSGSTLIACEKTNRKCLTMELDPHYCDVIIARWEKYTGKKAELLNGKT